GGRQRHLPCPRRNSRARGRDGAVLRHAGWSNLRGTVFAEGSRAGGGSVGYSRQINLSNPPGECHPEQSGERHPEQARRECHPERSEGSWFLLAQPMPPLANTMILASGLQ